MNDEEESNRLEAMLDLELGYRKWMLIYQTPNDESKMIVSGEVTVDELVGVLTTVIIKLKKGEFKAN